MREDEIRVAQALAAHFRATFRAGEDPPDIYLEFDSYDVAVEISTLAQLVVGTDGRLHPRRSDDEPPIRLANALNEELGPSMPDGRSVLLVLSSPLIRPHKVKAAARALIVSMLHRADEGKINEILKTRDADVIHVTLFDEINPARKKITAVVSNRNAGCDILENTKLMLETRIIDKSVKCANLFNRTDVWLALQEGYFFTEAYNLQLVMAQTKIENPFDKIVFIQSDASVAIVHEQTPSHARL